MNQSGSLVLYFESMLVLFVWMVAAYGMLPVYGKSLFRPRVPSAIGHLIVDVRFVLTNGQGNYYVSAYRRCASSNMQALFLALLYLGVLHGMHPGIKGRGRFEMQIAGNLKTAAHAPFWNPDLVKVALSPRGKLVLRRPTTCATIE
jgi:hypothetical protein